MSQKALLVASVLMILEIYREGKFLMVLNNFLLKGIGVLSCHKCKEVHKKVHEGIYSTGSL